MRKVLFILMIPVLFAACGTGSSGSPKAVVNSFIEASKKGDIDGLKKYVTSQDLALLEMAEKFSAKFDPSGSNNVKNKMSEEFKQNLGSGKIEVKDEKITGDDATVDVAVTQDGKTEVLPLALKKENGVWKISLMSTGMKASGMTQEKMDENVKKMEEGLKNMEGVNDSIAKAMEQLKNINTDSLKEVLKHSTKELEQLKETLEKSPQ